MKNVLSDEITCVLGYFRTQSARLVNLFGSAGYCGSVPLGKRVFAGRFLPHCFPTVVARRPKGRADWLCVPRFTPHVSGGLVAVPLSAVACRHAAQGTVPVFNLYRGHCQQLFLGRAVCLALNVVLPQYTCYIFIFFSCSSKIHQVWKVSVYDAVTIPQRNNPGSFTTPVRAI